MITFLAAIELERGSLSRKFKKFDWSVLPREGDHFDPEEDELDCGNVLRVEHNMKQIVPIVLFDPVASYDDALEENGWFTSQKEALAYESPS